MFDWFRYYRKNKGNKMDMEKELPKQEENVPLTCNVVLAQNFDFMFIPDVGIVSVFNVRK